MAASEILNHKSYKYALDVAEGRIVSAKYIKIACQNFLDDVHNPDCKYFIDIDQLNLITDLTSLINMPTGLRTGLSASEALVGFQWFFLVNTLCWYKKDKPENRRYEKAVLLIARKSGKSFLTALIIIILMMTEPKYSDFYSVAPDRVLSGIIKEQIATMLDVSPAINNHFKNIEKKVSFLPKKSKFIPLATSENRMDGRKAQCFIADEVGALKSNYPISAMESSQIDVIGPLGILISTAYKTTKNPMVDEIEYAQKVMDKTIEDDTIFALLYKPDDMDDWLSDEALLQANPLAIELPENLAVLKKKRAKAIEMESEQTNFKTKHLNIFVDGDVGEVYVAAQDLQKCKIDNYDWHGRNVHIGVDLSATTDNTAVAMMTYDEDLQKFIAKTWAFLPTDNIDKKNQLEKIDYNVMKRNGFCFFSGTSVIDYLQIEEFVMGLEAEYGVKINKIGYDRWNAISSANKWDRAGFDTVEIKQHSSVLHPATKLLKESILTEKFAYEKNQLFEINVSNAREVKDTNMNGYVNKKKSTGKIDMLAATINAMVLWNLDILNGPSVYETQGLEIIM